MEAKTVHTATPTPWILDDENVGHIRTDEGYAIADTVLDYSSIPFDEAEANAAFIVRACNSFQGLIDALKAIVNDPELSCSNCKEIAAAALAAAEQA